MIEPNEVVVRERGVVLDAPVPVDVVRAIAADYGIARVELIELDDDRWEVEGVDLYDRDVDLEIDANTGAVISVNRW